MNEFKIVTDYWTEFILLVAVVGLILIILIPIVTKAVKELDHKEKN